LSVSPAHSVTAPASSSSSSAVTSLENYFVNYRMHRDKIMTQEIATLKALSTNMSVSKATRDQATQTMIKDSQELKEETQIEGLLSAAGFPLNASTVTQNKAIIVVGAKHLSSDQVARIADTVMEVTHLAPQNIVVLPKNQG
ncbi:MAG: SpoIIIAH-like family protein, partial [Firmicutes bacterium]|nr:SpoIIIAH-like family protein [Bacillota bacterium]